MVCAFFFSVLDCVARGPHSDSKRRRVVLGVSAATESQSDFTFTDAHVDMMRDIKKKRLVVMPQPSMDPMLMPTSDVRSSRCVSRVSVFHSHVRSRVRLLI